MRLALDSGRPGAAQAGAEEAAADSERPVRVRLFLGDAAVEALVALGRAAEAARLVERVTAAGADPAHPWLLRMRGRAAAAAGRLDEAVFDLQRAADAFRLAGCRHEEARSRLALAGVLAEAGSVENAQAELRAVVESAEERGAALEARVARETLAGLGSRSITAEEVKLALEALHRPSELARAALGRLLGLDTAPGDHRLRTLLLEQIEQLASSTAGREREAGSLLRDYYVLRVGSQEVVADRLHLTRATFYRRLHLGWELLGERLTTLG
jgi:tetratricopeptide (TPR) repeat protein